MAGAGPPSGPVAGWTDVRTEEDPMKRFLSVLAAAAGLALAAGGADEPKEGAKVGGPLDYKMTGIDGKEVDLAQYKGKVVLLVNVASECGYTPQYKGLQELYDKYGKDGLVVIGVPSNDFGRQEPGTNAQILDFCRNNYKVTFPLLAKVVVKGDKKVPLYQFLTAEDTNPKFAGEIGWNFEKFLISRKGEVVGRFRSGVEPTAEQLVSAVKKELEAK
jgi:glutathione peroxidase